MFFHKIPTQVSNWKLIHCLCLCLDQALLVPCLRGFFLHEIINSILCHLFFFSFFFSFLFFFPGPSCSQWSLVLWNTLKESLPQIPQLFWPKATAAAAKKEKRNWSWPPMATSTKSTNQLMMTLRRLETNRFSSWIYGSCRKSGYFRPGCVLQGYSSTLPRHQ